MRKIVQVALFCGSLLGAIHLYLSFEPLSSYVVSAENSNEPSRSLPRSPISRPANVHPHAHNARLHALTQLQRERLQRIQGALGRWFAHELKTKRAQRPNGYIYAIDIAQSLEYAARCKDHALYQTLRSFADASLIERNPKENFTRHFVRWRVHANKPPDASGTTEALRLAMGLWVGGHAFQRSEDHKLAIAILEGYRRHATRSRGVWMIHNYYNLQTKSFSPNSYLIDYTPDFLREVLGSSLAPSWMRGLADETYALIDKAVSPSGLFYAVILPELKTLLPESLVFFSPNDVIKLHNSLTVANQIVSGRPTLARRVLSFAQQKGPRLKTLYYGRTGTQASQQEMGVAGYAILLRLAWKLRDDKVLQQMLPIFLEKLKDLRQHDAATKTYQVAEILLTLAHLGICSTPAVGQSPRRQGNNR